MKDGRTSNCNKNIANDQAAFGCRTVILNAHDQKTGSLLALERLLRSAWDFNGLTANPKITALNVTIFSQGLCDFPGNIRGNRDGRAAPQTRRINTEHCSICSNKWTTRKTRIGNAIGANISFEHSTACSSNRPSDRADRSKTGFNSIRGRTSQGKRNLPKTSRAF